MWRGIFLGSGGFFWGAGFWGARDFLVGGPLPNLFFCTNLLVRVKLGYPPKFNFLGKPLLGEKYMEGRKYEEESKKKKERRRIIPSLMATTSALACTSFAPIPDSALGGVVYFPYS